jgi:hypothetical protein
MQSKSSCQFPAPLKALQQKLEKTSWRRLSRCCTDTRSASRASPKIAFSRFQGVGDVANQEHTTLAEL